MEPSTTDRRVRRTQQAIRRAFESLIEEKGYDAVTVQDILDRADVGRSTFYAHYRDKEHLLLSGFDDVRAAIPHAGHATEEPSGRTEFLGPTLAIFEHVGMYRHTWKPLVRHGGADVVVRVLQDSAESLLRQHLHGHFGDTAQNADIEASTQFLVAGLIGLVTWWLDSEAPQSPAEVHSMYKRLAAPGAKRFLARS